jgi:lysylphosphatidylglycerol synthetase-like protein (DUF2156 family)
VTLDRPRLIFEILRDAWALYRADWRTYLLVVAVVVVPANLVVGGIALGGLSGEPRGQTLGELGVTVALQQLVTLPLTTAMVIAVLLARLRDEPATAGAAIQAGFDVFAALLVVIVLSALAIAAGAVLIIPGIYLAVRLLVSVPATVIEGRRGVDALRRSWELVELNWWRTLGTLLTMNTVAALAAGFVIALPFTMIATSTDSQAWSLIGAIAGEIATVPLTAIGIALLFGDLRARKAARDGDQDARAAA